MLNVQDLLYQIYWENADYVKKILWQVILSNYFVIIEFLFTDLGQSLLRQHKLQRSLVDKNVHLCQK